VNRRAKKSNGRKSGGRKKNKVRRCPKFYVPLAERIRMCQEYVQGGPDNSMQKISIRYNRTPDTVARIVKSPEMEEIGKAMADRLISDSADKVVDRIEYEVKNKQSKHGAMIAMELAERWGGIPAKVSRLQGQFLSKDVGTKEVSEDEQVSQWISKLTRIAMERGRIFDMPMPEFEEFKDELDLPLPVQTIRKKEQAE